MARASCASHSSSLLNTVAKCIANVINQLRILRCYYKIKEVSGYVFPKLPNKDGKCMNKTIVTRVDVQWEGLEFRVLFTCQSLLSLKMSARSSTISGVP